MLQELKALRDTGKETWTNLGDRGIKKTDRLVVMAQIAQAAFRFTNIIHDSDESINDTWQGDGSPPMNPQKQAFLRSQGAKLIAKVGQSLRDRRGRLFGEEHEFVKSHLTEEPADLELGTEPYILSGDGLNDDINEAFAVQARDQFRVVK